MIPSQYGDVELLLIEYIRSKISGIKVSRELEQGKTLPQVILAVEPVGTETNITSRFSVLLEAHAWRTNGNSDVHAAKDVMEQVLYVLQQAPQNIRRVVRFDSVLTSSVEKTSEGAEYVEGSIVLSIGRLSA